LLAAWAVAFWTLEGMYPVMFLGWFASLILYWRLRKVPAKTEKQQNIWTMLPTLRRLFIPMTFVIFFRACMLEPMAVYLPTLMNLKGASLTEANLALTFWELAGVGGALLGGTLSDRLGRTTVLSFTVLIAPFLTFLFLQSSGIFTMLVLLLHGLIALSTTPVLMAITQEHLPHNRAVSNGIFISISFLVRPLVAVIIGYLGDGYGLESAYFWGALFSFLAIPAIFFLPTLERES
jgi:FSR family fosmidomycin resistance protein-like MFS transporter